MENNEYILIDTKAFDSVLAQKESLLREYDAIKEEYQEIIKTLMLQWKGKGAEAFERDANIVKRNMNGQLDALKTMYDMLEDCREVIRGYDTELGNYNTNGGVSEG